ncbi:MAG: histidinol dehydrogenase, partial [Rivularia sp. (in: cyanobacteria)]
MNGGSIKKTKVKLKERVKHFARTLSTATSNTLIPQTPELSLGKHCPYSMLRIINQQADVIAELQRICDRTNDEQVLHK